MRALTDLQEKQPERLRIGDLDNFHRCQDVIDKINILLQNHRRRPEDDEHGCGDESTSSLFPFQLILDDPAGNSYIENPYAPSIDKDVQSTRYARTLTQNLRLGLQPTSFKQNDDEHDDRSDTNFVQTIDRPSKIGITSDDTDDDFSSVDGATFVTTCPQCHRATETRMCISQIPHFKEIVLMCLLCEHCGYKSNEIKGGGAISEQGLKITLNVNSIDDLKRDVLKSDTAGVTIPHLELELAEGSLGGVYTTVEGLLRKMRERLEVANPFGLGDSVYKQHRSNDGDRFSEPDPRHQKLNVVVQSLSEMADGNQFPFTLIITDPLANSFVGPTTPDEKSVQDSRLEVEPFERTFEQNEILGLNDISV
jgi:zinc finger protein